MSLLDQIREAGVVGAGGAGFPTHIKLDCQVEYLLVNAAECEPLLYTDKYIVRTYPDQLVEAADAVGEMLSAREIHIAIKRINTAEIQAVEAAIRRNNSRARVFPLGNYYPAGDEQMIVCDITGKIVPPGGLPLDVGAVVSNAATMLGIHDAMRGSPVTHKYLTVSGAVSLPSVLHVPVGISFRQCIDACGGPSTARYLIVDGGPMMGRLHGKEELDDLIVTKTTSAILLVPEENNLLARQKETNMENIINRAKSACIQCSFCTDLCPRRLTGHPLRPHMIMRSLSMRDIGAPWASDPVLEEALACCDCGLCETYACPMGLSPRQINKYIKSKLRGRRPDTRADCSPSGMRELRKVAPQKIMARMGLSALYEKKAARFLEVEAKRVRIPVQQHIGAPAEPIVEPGDKVRSGQLIARGAAGKPSANIHASISGAVIKIGEVIVIDGGER